MVCTELHHANQCCGKASTVLIHLMNAVSSIVSLDTSLETSQTSQTSSPWADMVLSASNICPKRMSKFSKRGLHAVTLYKLSTTEEPVSYIAVHDSYTMDFHAVTHYKTFSYRGLSCQYRGARCFQRLQLPNVGQLKVQDSEVGSLVKLKSCHDDQDLGEIITKCRQSWSLGSRSWCFNPGIRPRWGK